MKIGLIGDHITDIYIYGTMKRFSPESPIPIFDITHQEERSGGASNVNNNLKALGAYTLYYFDELEYSIKKRYVCDGHIMFRCDEDKTSKTDCLDLTFPDDCQYIILSDYNKGVLRTSQQLISKLKAAGKTVIVDPKRSLVNYQGADIVKMNESEYERFNLHPGDMVESLEFYNIGTYVITRADKGPLIVTRDGITTVKGITKEVVDVTGAGDIFIAAMTYYMANGEHIYDACVKANYLAALSVGHFGTYMLTEEDIKKVNRRVVFTNGCFDVIHKGHIEYLQKSKDLGDYLIIGLNSDASVRKLKGENRPINKQDDRAAVLQALKCVDEVIIFEEDTPYELIKSIKPDVITKGGDYTSIDQVVGNDLAEVILIPYIDGFSTTNILETLNADC